MSNSETERADVPESQADLTQDGKADMDAHSEDTVEAVTSAETRKKPAPPKQGAAKNGKADAKSAKPKQDAAPTADLDEKSSMMGGVEDGSVKLTDISDIVAKYSAIESVFANDDENDDEPEIDTLASLPETGEAELEHDTLLLEGGAVFEADEAELQAEEEDESAREEDDDEEYSYGAVALDEDADDLFEDDDERQDHSEHEDVDAAVDYGPVSAHDVADSRLPERPRIVFRRPQMKNELFSNWSEDEHQHHRPAYDFKSDHLFHRARRERDEENEEPVLPEAPVIDNHRRTVSRSIALSIGLPIAGGALFALLLFVQKDLKLADYWGSIAATASNSTETAAVDTPTPDFTKHPSLRQQEASGIPVVSTNDAPTIVSPETGVVRATPAPVETVNTVVAAVAPETATNTAPVPKIAPNSVYMARLTVTDTEGSSLSPIPLSLAVAPAAPEQKLRIRVSGLPEGAKLSAGTDLGSGEWMLRQGELENLHMTLAPGFSGQITLLAEVIDDATHIQAAPSQMVEVRVTPGQMVVQPAAAPPDPAPHSFAETMKKTVEPEPSGPTLITPQTSPFAELRVQAPDQETAAEQKVAALPSPTQADAPATPEPSIATPTVALPVSDGLMAKGDEFMNHGDIVAARLFYERALKKGNPHAATAIGKSYDPVVYEQLKVHGVLPDPNLAVEWYQRGVKNGDATAAAHIQALNTWLQQ